MYAGLVLALFIYSVKCRSKNSVLLGVILYGLLSEAGRVNVKERERGGGGGRLKMRAAKGL